MLSKNKTITNVRTNIITGFLGVGKTTAILNLLKQRPSDEYWSILVNEFGEMGIDGHLMENDDPSITIKQVPGGCICCAAGLPLQVAVNQLLKQTHPDRLIIEPSGMGHPRRILQSLTSEHYNDVLDMRACVCLLDPRKLSDSRYMESELFVDQVAVADIVIANKTDLSSKQDSNKFKNFIANLPHKKITHWVEKGQIDIEWLNSGSNTLKQPLMFKQKNTSQERLLEDSMNKITLNFDLNHVFQLSKINKYVVSLKAERIKGILNTDKGFIIINYADGILQTETVKNTSINRLEIISLEKMQRDEIESNINDCTDK